MQRLCKLARSSDPGKPSLTASNLIIVKTSLPASVTFPCSSRLQKSAGSNVEVNVVLAFADKLPSLQDIFDEVKNRDPHQEEFHQAVEEVLDTVMPVFKKHEELLPMMKRCGCSRHCPYSVPLCMAPHSQSPCLLLPVALCQRQGNVLHSSAQVQGLFHPALRVKLQFAITILWLRHSRQHGGDRLQDGGARASNCVPGAPRFRLQRVLLAHPGERVHGSCLSARTATHRLCAYLYCLQPDVCLACQRSCASGGSSGTCAPHQLTPPDRLTQ